MSTGTCSTSSARRRARLERLRVRGADLDEDAALAGMVVTDELAEIQRAVQSFEDAGVTHLSMHQVGPRQEPFLDVGEGCSQEIRSSR